MNKSALLHQAKSEYAYAYDQETLHITLRTAKDDIKKVEIIYGDPFNWVGDKDHKPYWKNNIETLQVRYQSADFDYYFIEIKPPYLRTKYAFLLYDDDKKYLFGARHARVLSKENEFYETFDLSEYFNYPYLNHEDLHHTPTWVKDTVWYQIFPDRFYANKKNSHLEWGKLPVNNHELYGGNLKGIIEKLPYLKDLGISGIYFTPLFKSPSAHKYDTTDYYLIDPQFGTNEDFKNLVDHAHQLDIKVMLDGVFNHCGYDHPFFQDVIKNGESSIYKDCFYIDEFPVINFPLNEKQKPINYHGQKLNLKTFAFTPYMPKWNTSHPITSSHLLDVIKFWIKEYDIDGWRLDVSNEISHDFLRQIKKASRETKKDTFILGENWDSSMPWLQGDQLDSVMNYDLSYPLWKYLEHKIDLSTFKDLITNYLAKTPKNVMENMFNLVGCHDTVRIKRRLNDDTRRMKLSYVFMFLSSGAPNIYYGDEIGMTGDHDPDNRRCMLWNENDQDLDFKAFTSRLIALRNDHLSFKTYDYDFINSNILVFEKQSKNDSILVLINNGEQTQISLPKEVTGRYKNLFNLETIDIRDKMDIETYGFLILSKEG
ncbi:MAG: alpha-glycosidase [Acholeplasmataceae bacterium]|nr:alpha-glycosidase [Acholeplasmataceae bacterium]